MTLYITVTPDNTKEYPIHAHDVYEIIYYVKGKGHLHTAEKDYPFMEGSIFIIPPHVKHCSVSSDGFKNICVHTDDVLLDGTEVLYFNDNATSDGETLIKMLMRVYYSDIEKPSALTVNLYNAYRDTVLNICGEKDNLILEKIKSEFTENIGNPKFSPLSSFKDKGYSADHLRVLFKNKFALTPTSYFINLKMAYAKNLFDAYGERLKINEIASMCGYADPLYFSKTFKKLTGKSPKEYLKSKDKE